jgi:hypothetical protein
MEIYEGKQVKLRNFQGNNENTSICQPLGGLSSSTNLNLKSKIF